VLTPLVFGHISPHYFTQFHPLNTEVYAAFFTTVFSVVEKLCIVFKLISAEKKLFNPAQVA